MGYVGEEKEREKETNYGVKDGADFFFVERERERVWRDWAVVVSERNQWVGERALDLLFFSIIYTFDKNHFFLNF